MPGMPRPVEFVFTKQQRIAELARNCPGYMALGRPWKCITSTSNGCSQPMLGHARTGPSAWTDKLADEYEVNLEANLQNLLDRAKSGTHVGVARASSAHPQGRLAQRDSPSSGDTHV